MSQENVDLVRRMTEVANITPADASLFEPLLAPDYRIENTVTAVTDRTYYGAAGCVEWLNDMSDAFAAGARYEIETTLLRATTSLSRAWPSWGKAHALALRFDFDGLP